MDTQATILRLAINNKVLPREAQKLQKIVSRILPRSTLRIVRNRIEIVTFTKPSITQLEMLRRRLGATNIDISNPESLVGAKKHLASLYIELLRENRFWEAHVIGEEIWRRKGSIGRYLAVLAAAYAKAQEGVLDSARVILGKALQSNALAPIIDPECLRNELVRLYDHGEAQVIRCIDVHKLSIILRL